MLDFIKNYKKENYLIPILFVCSFVLYLISSLPMGKIFSVDEATIVMPSKILKKYGEFQYIDEYNIKYNTYWFGQPGYSINSRKVLYPRGFIGMRLLFTPFYFFIGDNSTNILNSFCLAASVILVYSIAKRIFQDEFTGLAVSSIYMFSPFILIESVYIYPEATVLFFSLSHFYYLFLSYTEKDNKYLILSFLFLSVTILIKFFYILLIIPSLLYLNHKHINKKFLISSIFLLLLFITPQLINNLQLHNNILGFDYFIKPYDPYQTSYNPYGLIEKPNFKTVSYYFIDNFLIPKDGGKIYLFHLKTLPILLLKLSPFFIFLPLGILWCYKKRKRRITTFIFLTLFIFFLIFGNMGFYYGMHELSVRSSYVRYMILPFTLLLILTGGMFSFLREKKIQKTLLILITTIVLTLSAFSISQNHIQKYFYVSGNSLKSQWLEIEDSILNQTENNSVIFVTIDEVLLSMNRKPFYFANIPYNNDTEIMRVTTSLLKDGINVYVFRPKQHPEWYRVRGVPNYNFSSIENIQSINLYLPSKSYELLKLISNNDN